MTPLEQFDDGLRKMGNGIRRAHAAFNEADAGFIQALEGLQTITEQRGSLDATLTEMQETIARLEVLVLNQSRDLQAVRAELQQIRERP
jgi:uncharacterized phage infection (PIP) family protein YhgE